MDPSPHPDSRFLSPLRGVCLLPSRTLLSPKQGGLSVHHQKGLIREEGRVQRGGRRRGSQARRVFIGGRGVGAKSFVMNRPPAGGPLPHKAPAPSRGHHGPHVLIPPAHRCWQGHWALCSVTEQFPCPEVPARLQFIPDRPRSPRCPMVWPFPELKAADVTPCGAPSAECLSHRRGRFRHVALFFKSSVDFYFF